MTTVNLTIDDVADLTYKSLKASNTNDKNARCVTESVVASELDGIHSHGLARLPTYCEHARCGKVDGNAEPTMSKSDGAAFTVDTKDGFAHPAIDLGFEILIPRAKELGVAALGVINSYNCGVLGYHTEKLANYGLVALAFTNAPASIAPFGGIKAVFGTNPISCAVPGENGEATFVIDQSSSVVAKSEIVVHNNNGEPIPEGWALDKDGNPTTDPKTALGGTMVPAGGYKGAGQALIVETMAAALTGATLSINASSFADNTGGPTRTGQFFIAINPDHFGGEQFRANMKALAEAITSQDGTRLPGQRRIQARDRIRNEGVAIKQALYDKLQGYCE